MMLLSWRSVLNSFSTSQQIRLGFRKILILIENLVIISSYISINAIVLVSRKVAQCSFLDQQETVHEHAFKRSSRNTRRNRLGENFMFQEGLFFVFWKKLLFFWRLMKVRWFFFLEIWYLRGFCFLLKFAPAIARQKYYFF